MKIDTQEAPTTLAYCPLPTANSTFQLPEYLGDIANQVDHANAAAHAFANQDSLSVQAEKETTYYIVCKFQS